MDFKELCKKRFSARAYSGEPIPADKISYIQECVRLAPSACNKQPWLFLAVKSEEARKKLRACRTLLVVIQTALYLQDLFLRFPALAVPLVAVSFCVFFVLLFQLWGFSRDLEDLET